MVLNTLFFQNFTYSDTIISLPLLICAIFAGFAIAITAATVDRFYCHAFVKALVRDGAVAEEKAKTLEELPVKGKWYIRFALRPGKHLVKMVAKTDGADGKVRYYLPEEKRIRAELRYENGKHPFLVLILCLIVLAAAMVFVQFFLPELLTMVDNMITTLKGE